VERLPVFFAAGAQVVLGAHRLARRTRRFNSKTTKNTKAQVAFLQRVGGLS